MDKTTKTILIAIGSLLLVCVCAVGVVFATGAYSVGRIAQWADTNTIRDLNDVAQLLSEIAVITLPDGYGSPYGVHIGDLTSVGFASQSKNTHIVLTQFPAETVIDPKQMLKMVRKYSVNPNNSWNAGNMTLIEEKPVTIRGQETILSISEGISSDGTHYRSAVATFQGNQGPVLLMIAGPEEEWDEQMVDDFVASIQ